MAEYSCASEVFEKLIKQDSKPANHYHNALANMSLGNYKKALMHFEISKLDVQLNIPSRINLAVCLIEVGEEDKALVSLKEISDEIPEINEAWFLLLKLYRRRKDIDQIKRILEASKAYIETSEDWKKSEIYLLYYLKQYSKAIEKINSYYTDKTKEILSLLAKCYTKVSKFEKAIEIYLKVLEEEKNSINFYNIAAAYSNLTNDTDLLRGIEYANSSLEMDGNCHQSYYCKALIVHKMGSINEALEFVNIALNIDTGNSEYLYKKAELLNLSKQHTKSMRILNEILQKDQYNNLALRLKGIILLQTNELVNSEAILGKALSIEDTDQRTLAYFAISKLAQKKQNEVLEFLGVGDLVKEYQLDLVPDFENLEQFNNDLEMDIKNHSLLRKEPNGLAARNGYLTDNLFVDKTKSIVVFKKLLLQKIKQYINSLPTSMQHHMLKHKTHDFEINSWATWVKGDGFIDKHIHEESWISGAYYCRVPEITEQTTTKKGYFEYGCIPNDIEITIEKERGYIKPVEGKLIIFPSYLYHQTIPHESQEDRISIAFDLTPISWKK